MNQIIPKPVSVTPGSGGFVFTPQTRILAPAGEAEAWRNAEYLAGVLRPLTGYDLPVVAASGAQTVGQLLLTLSGAEATIGNEGYQLAIALDGVTLRANAGPGLFYGVQTLLQLLPASADSGVAPGFVLPAGEITDYPRFGWRGSMLDVARHFFPVEEVKHFIDLLAMYKMNRLHLHLSDDQGWRIEIRTWPRLTEVGGITAVGGGDGGYYSQGEYVELATYAAERYITVVPEIDLPGHTNAALAAYAELNCSGVAPALYTGTQVGFSTLCVDKEITYTFLDDVIRELASITPGPYIHIGGDESHSTPLPDYIRFMERVQPIVAKYHKQIVAWEEIGQAQLLPNTLVQQWNTNPERRRDTVRAVEQGAKVIMSPANRIYLDMQYSPETPLGQHWAAYVPVKAAYDWDPATDLEGVAEDAIAGVEAGLWTETLANIPDLEYMVLPRLAGVAEIGWTPAVARSWEEYRARLAAQGVRWKATGVNFFETHEVDW